MLVGRAYMSEIAVAKSCHCLHRICQALNIVHFAIQWNQVAANDIYISHAAVVTRKCNILSAQLCKVKQGFGG